MRPKKQGLENKYRWDSCLAHSNGGKIRVKITYMKENRSLWEQIFVFLVYCFYFSYLTAREARGMRMFKVFE